MKKIAILGLLAVACVAGSASAAPSASANITATVLDPILIVGGDSLDFGTLATNGVACTAVLTPDGGPAGASNGTMGGTCYSAPGTFDDSDWTVDAAATQTYTLTLDSCLHTMTGPICGGTDTIDTTAFELDSTGAVGEPTGPTCGPWTGVGTGLPQDFAIGATASLAADQCGGFYDSVAFTITATYP
jgi:hypothetical protein